MWNSDKALFDKLRERLGGKYKEGMLTYKEEKHPELDEAEVLKAIHTISIYSKLPEEKIKEAIIELINKQIFYERFVDAINEFRKSAKLLRDAAFTASEAVIRMYPLKNIVEESPTSYSRGMDNCGEMTLSSDAVEHLRQLILVQSPCNVNGSNWDRIESQHEIANRNRHTSRHVPFYFKIFGQSRFVPRKSGRKGHTKFNRNVRPKGTHTNFKFYR